MDKKTITELRPVIRSLGQDFKHLKSAYDALRALASLKTDGSAEVVTLAHNQFVQAIWAMNTRLTRHRRKAPSGALSQSSGTEIAPKSLYAQGKPRPVRNVFQNTIMSAIIHATSILRVLAAGPC
jgi:hypothetical protein